MAKKTSFAVYAFNYQYKDGRWDGILTGPPVEWANFLDDYQHLSPEWTGHELLGFSFQFVDASGRGPGSGKADPFLAGSKALAEFLIGSEEGLSTIKRFSTLQ